MKTLVVCYSRSGHTRDVGTSIAEALGADFDLIVSRDQREGLLGYLRCGYEATFDRLTEIAHPTRKVDDYDLVVVGSPTWNASLASPVRTYLTRYAPRVKSVAFFVTCGGRGGERVIEQMTKLARREPHATLVVREADFRTGRVHMEVDAFAHRLAHQVGHPPAQAA